MQPFRVLRHKKAFTLIEVVIALAVTTFCVIILLGLLPVGVNSALASRRDTRSAYLAEQIVSDLRSSPFVNATIVSQSGSTLAALPAFSLATASTNCLMCDGADNVLGTATTAQYASGVNNANANFLVQIAVTPTAIPNLSSISVEVSAPAQGPVGSRSRYGFQTMIGNRQ